MYNVQIRNTYNIAGSPIVLVISESVTLLSGYKCIVVIDDTRIRLKTLTDGCRVVNNSTIITEQQGSYSIQIFIDDVFISVFSLYVFNSYTSTNQQNIFSVFCQELPAIYSNNDLLNLADNYANSKLLAELYSFVYDNFYNSVTSIGSRGGYNQLWEEVYFGARGLIGGSSNPAQAIKTLMQIPYTTGMTYKAMSILISKVLFNLFGVPTPVAIYQQDSNSICQIKIYRSSDTWLLGEPGASELGDTTILGSEFDGSLINWIIYLLPERLMPCSLRWEINFLTNNIFINDYNVDEVTDNYYIDYGIIYDAYSVVSNNNTINTKGYLLK